MWQPYNRQDCILYVAALQQARQHPLCGSLMTGKTASSMWQPYYRQDCILYVAALQQARLHPLCGSLTTDCILHAAAFRKPGLHPIQASLTKGKIASSIDQLSERFTNYKCSYFKRQIILMATWGFDEDLIIISVGVRSLQGWRHC